MKNQELEQRWENDKYQEEKKDFLSDKCRHCMEYVNQETEECENACCESNMPEEYKALFRQTLKQVEWLQTHRNFWYKSICVRFDSSPTTNIK